MDPLTLIGLGLVFVSIIVSTINYNLLRPNDRGFTGLDNYVSALTSGDLWPSIVATVLITASSVVLSVVFGMIFALLLDRPMKR